MIKAKHIFETLTNVLPFQRKSSLDWIVPASIGLGIGVAAGLGLGVLIAPSSGEVTRQKLVDGANQVKEKARLAAQRVSEKVHAGQNHVAGTFTQDAGRIS